MKSYGKLIPLLALSVFLLSGCLIKSGDELLQLPKPAENYVALQTQLDQVLAQGGVYAAPESGEYRSTIQLKDVDGDGEDEAIVFFRESDNSGSFFVSLYKKEEDDYTLAGKITGTGTAVYSVDYPQMDSEGNRAIVVSWTLGTDLNRGMTVCMLQDGKFTSLLDTEYTAYTFADLDQDGQTDLLTLAPDDRGQQAAKLFRLEEGKMQEEASLLMSGGGSIARLSQGMTADQKMAVYVDQEGSNKTGLFTDIIQLYQGTLVNLTEQFDEGERDTYRSFMVYTRDVDQDGIMEIPQIVSVSTSVLENGDAVNSVYLLDWYQYSLQQTPKKTMTCFANWTDGWIFQCPDTWEDCVTAVWREGTDSKSCIRFQTTQKQPVGLVEIYKMEESSWAQNTEQADYILLDQQDHFVYTAKLLETPETNSLGVSEAQVKSLFSMISGDWVS